MRWMKNLKERTIQCRLACECITTGPFGYIILDPLKLVQDCLLNINAVSGLTEMEMLQHCDEIASTVFHRPPCSCSTQAFGMSPRREAAIGFQLLCFLAMMLATWLTPKALLAKVSSPRALQATWIPVGFLHLVGVPVLLDKLVNTELFVLATKESDSDWFVFCDLFNGVSDTALVYVALPTLEEMEIYGPGVAIVDEELNIHTMRLVFATDVDVCAGSVFQDGHLPKDLFKHSHIVYYGACVVDNLFLFLDFMSPGGGEALSP